MLSAVLSLKVLRRPYYTDHSGVLLRMLIEDIEHFQAIGLSLNEHRLLNNRLQKTSLPTKNSLSDSYA